MQWDLGSTRVSRGLVGVPPTSRGGNFQHRLVLSQEPPKPSVPTSREGRRPRRPVLRSATEGGSRSRSQLACSCSGLFLLVALVLLLVLAVRVGLFRNHLSVCRDGAGRDVRIAWRWNGPGG